MSHFENRAITEPILRVWIRSCSSRVPISSPLVLPLRRRAAAGRQTASERWTRSVESRRCVSLPPAPVSSAAPVTLLSHAVEQLSFIRGWLRSAGEGWSLYSSCWLTAGSVSRLISHYDNRCLLSARRSAGSLLSVFAIHICVCVCIQSPVGVHHLWLLQ